MSIILWNCRGSGGFSTIPTLRHYLRSTGAVLAFISETKCSEKFAKRRIARLQLQNYQIIPSRGRGGGLWLLWANEISVTILESSFSFIVAEVQLGPAAKPWLLFAAYGECDDRRNDVMWVKLEGYARNQALPVCAIGDFNCITDQIEKQGGNSVLKAKHLRFRSFLQKSGLLDLGHSGPAYTWANNQPRRALILERLDRCIASTDWINLFPNSKVFHLPNYSSDHLPILLRVDRKPRRKVRQFRVEQWWSAQHEFGDLCMRVGRVPNQSWEALCSSFKKEVNNWEESGRDPNWEVVRIEAEMTQLVNAPQTESVRERIKILHEQYQRYMAAQEAYWLQRSRLNWNLQGDQNTRFFHMTATVRRRRNRVQALQNEQGEWLVREDEIRRQFVRHFKEIYKAGPELSSNELRLFTGEIEEEIERIPTSAISDLEKLPTEQEIFWALNALGPMKAPGPDGVNAALVQQQWKAFGPTVVNEVMLFFQTGQMKPNIAHSNLVLIPKIDMPTKVSEFRPISVCNLLYKIISKLLAKRMQPFMADIISNAQTAFIPGRKIAENVILLREIFHSFKKPFDDQPQFVLKADLAKSVRSSQLEVPLSSIASVWISPLFLSMDTSMCYIG